MKSLFFFTSVSLWVCGALGQDAAPKDGSKVVVMDPMVVADTKAGVFCFSVQPTEPPRVWVRRTDGVAGTARSNPELRKISNLTTHLVPLRSFELRDGDEVIRIGDRAVAEMPRADVVPALLSRLNPQPVILEVRASGERKSRVARYVLHTEVRAGVKVPRP